MEVLSLPNGDTIEILPEEQICKYDFYANVKSGFIGYCMEQNDADAMNLLRKIGVNAMKETFEDYDGNMWFKCKPNEIQLKKIKKQYGIKPKQKFPHEVLTINP